MHKAVVWIPFFLLGVGITLTEAENMAVNTDATVASAEEIAGIVLPEDLEQILPHWESPWAPHAKWCRFIHGRFEKKWDWINNSWIRRPNFTAHNDTRTICRPAQFGKRENVELGSRLLLTEPADACDEFTCKQYCGNQSICLESPGCKNGILLIARGGCPFYQKYLQAIKAGAAAVLIADNAPNPQGLIQLIRGQEEVDPVETANPIPALAVSYETAESIRSMLVQKEREMDADIQAFQINMNATQDYLDGLDFANTLRAHPDHFVSAFNLAINLRRNNRPESALLVMDHALRIDPSCVDCWNFQGDFKQEWGQLMQSWEAYQTMMKLDPSKGIDEAAGTIVECSTTRGPFKILVFARAAAYAREHFLGLVQAGYFTDMPFYRVVKDTVAYFGISSDPQETSNAAKSEIMDDHSFDDTVMKRGMISFAGDDEDSRKYQMYVALDTLPRSRRQWEVDVSPQTFTKHGKLGDRLPWETPFALIIEGIEVFNTVYDGYNLDVDVSQLIKRGGDYWKEEFPKLDKINGCSALPPHGGPKKKQEI